MKKFLISVSVALAVVGSVPGSLAVEGQVTEVIEVTLEVELVGSLSEAECALEVPAGADGIAVLDAAVADECIDSYDTETHPQFGERVTCINDICETPDATFNAVTWLIHLNGEFAQVGVSAMELEDGDELRFDFNTWLTGLV